MPVAQGSRRERTLPAMRWLIPLLAVTALGAAPAQVSTRQVGEVAPPGATGPSCGGCSVVQADRAAGSPPYGLDAGVIPEWRVRGGSSVGPGDRVRLRVFRRSGSAWTVVAETADVQPAVGA